MVTLSEALRKQFPKTNDPATSFLLSHAPQSPYLQSQYGVDQFYGSYLSILAQLPPGTIDFLNIQFYNNAASQGQIPDTTISLALTQPRTLPAAFGPPGGGQLTVPALSQEQIAIGQLAAGNIMQPPQPTIAPLCRLNNSSCNWSLMYWLQNQTDTALADADVDLWSPPQRGALSPPTRVVYYMNGAMTPPMPSSYSRANVIIVGFIYPVSVAPEITNPLDRNGPRIPTPNPDPTLPPWASFGFFYAGGMAGAPYGLTTDYSAWRDAEPGKRKLMLGIGGAAATPPYATWNSGSNVAIVAQGLAAFKARFAIANGYEIDGFDMDYEDSNALNPQIPQTTTPPASSLAVVSTAKACAAAENYHQSHAPSRSHHHSAHAHTRVLIANEPASIAGLVIWGVVTVVLLVFFVLFCVSISKNSKR